MRKTFFAVVLSITGAFVLGSCGQDSNNAPSDAAMDDRRSSSARNEIVFNFSDGFSGWSANIVGHTEEQTGAINFENRIARTPESGEENSSYLLRGQAYSPSFIFYIVRKFGPEDGLLANQSYDFRITLKWVTNASTQCIGPGGSLGEADLLVTSQSVEPRRFLDEQEEWRFGFERSDFSLIGNFGYESECDRTYKSVEKTAMLARSLSTNERGEAWVIIGLSPVALTQHEIYFDEIRVGLIQRGQ